MESNIRVNIERSDGLLVDWMLEQGWAIHITPSSVVAHRRPRRSKSDPSDAYLLAYLLYVNDPDCRPLTRSSNACCTCVNSLGPWIHLSGPASAG